MKKDTVLIELFRKCVRICSARQKSESMIFSQEVVTNFATHLTKFVIVLDKITNFVYNLTAGFSADGGGEGECSIWME